MHLDIIWMSHWHLKWNSICPPKCSSLSLPNSVKQRQSSPLSRKTLEGIPALFSPSFLAYGKFCLFPSKIYTNSAFLSIFLLITLLLRHPHLNVNHDTCMCAKLLQSYPTLHDPSQAPLPMGFSRQEYWSGLSCPPPGDLPDPAIKPMNRDTCLLITFPHIFSLVNI